MLIQQPLVAANRQGQFDVVCTVSGGGLSGQAGAVRHGLSKALMRHEPDLRAVLKRGGFLTRDPRVVERKKYGRPKRAAASSSPSARQTVSRSIVRASVTLLEPSFRGHLPPRVMSGAVFFRRHPLNWRVRCAIWRGASGMGTAKALAHP